MMKYAFCFFAYIFAFGDAYAQSWIEYPDGVPKYEAGRDRSTSQQLSSAKIPTQNLNLIMDAAWLSANSYGGQEYQATVNGRGWVAIAATFDNEGLPHSKELMESGIRSVLYKKDGQLILAFRGTDMKSLSDWGSNFKQNQRGPSASPQYKYAAEIFEYVQRTYGNNVILTGHSLGGGLAQYVADRYQIKAVTFNAAGLVGGEYRRGANPNIANINSASDPVSQNGLVTIPGGVSLQPRGNQIGQEYLIDSRTSNTISASQALKIHFINSLIDTLGTAVAIKITNNSYSAVTTNRTTTTATQTTAQVSSIGPISFQPAQSYQPNTRVQPRILTSGTNTYTEGGWRVTYGYETGLRQGVSGAQLGLPTNNDGFTVVSNEGAPFIYAQKTFKAGAGNNGTFNFTALAAFITTEQQRCAPCNVFGLDKTFVTFVSSSGQTITKSMQDIYGVNAQGHVVASNNPGNGTLTTPLRQVVQSMQMAPGSTMRVVVNVNNSVNNDLRYPSSFAVTNVRAR